MKSKGELIIIAAIKKIFGNTKIIRQYGVGDKLTLDIYLPAYNIGIEYDGIQHFKEINFFHKEHIDFLNQQARDRRKDDLCKELGIELIRIAYTENTNLALIIKKILRHTNNVKAKKVIVNKYQEKQKEYRRLQYEKYKEYRAKKLIQ